MLRQGNVHPWALIGEFQTPFSLWRTRTTYAFFALLGLAGLAGPVLAWRRRWALLAVLGGMIATSLAMRRNLAPAVILAGPILAVAAHLAWRRLAQRAADKSPAPRRRVALAVSAGLLAIVAGASIWWLAQVVTNRFYVYELRDEWRFGFGLSHLSLPVDACRWLDEHLAQPRLLFVDYNTSSSLPYFSRKVAGVPVLTNTWAFPPSRMSEVMKLTYGFTKIDSPASQLLGNLALLQVWPHTRELRIELIHSDQWALVYARTEYLIFARRTPGNAALIAANEVTQKTLDLQVFIDDCRRADPDPASGLKAGAAALQELGWYEQAEKVWQECVRAAATGISPG